MTTTEGAQRAPGRGKVFASITDTIGDTPLVAMDRIAKEKDVAARLLGKLHQPSNGVLRIVGRVAKNGAQTPQGLHHHGQGKLEHDRSEGPFSRTRKIRISNPCEMVCMGNDAFARFYKEAIHGHRYR